MLRTRANIFPDIYQQVSRHLRTPAAFICKPDWSSSPLFIQLLANSTLGGRTALIPTWGNHLISWRWALAWSTRAQVCSFSFKENGRGGALGVESLFPLNQF